MRGWIARLQQVDATVRGVPSFDVEVHRLALPDALEALAKSAAGQPECHTELAAIAAEISSARL